MRKKKNTGFVILLAILALAGIKYLGNQSEDIETVQNVTESDLTELENTNTVIEEKSGMDAGHNIRVLIMGNDYKGETHETVHISSKDEMCIQYGEELESIEAGKVLTIKPDDERFLKGNIIISSVKEIVLEHVERAEGTPSYEGDIELITTAEGIVIINELPVEDYLKAVVPSEMPASYELEALKAQAVCARTYAYRQMEEYGYPEYKAHVNDSTDYQVYGNLKSQESTNQAIKETVGQTVYYQGEMAATYYYSTSCGQTTDMSAWGEKTSEESGYLKSVNVEGENGDYEKNLPWYRWSAEISAEHLSDLVGLNTGRDIGNIENIEVTKRGSGDVATEIKVKGEKGTVIVETENKIRSALGGEGYRIKRNDGSVVESSLLLPSAFFTIKKMEDKFLIEGGGYGHGIGMSQNGANEMAKAGAGYKEILELFYRDIEVR